MEHLGYRGASHKNKCSDRSMEVSPPTLLENYDRPTDRPTNQPTDRHEGKKLHL